MEDLILAFVTFVASMFILSHFAGAGDGRIHYCDVRGVDPSCRIPCVRAGAQSAALGMCCGGYRAICCSDALLRCRDSHL
jgi:hypothetical protein